MRDKTSFLILSSVAGFLTLALFSIIQRLMLGLGFMTSPKAYIVPLIYGGSIGFWLGLRQLRIRSNEIELQANLDTLQSQSDELQMTEEMLRQQVDEYHEILDRLQAGERRLQEQNEDLTATEEMLRCQIEEYRETYERLLASERKLQEQNEELMVTEEMLREQIGENEENQRRLKESNRSLQALFDVSPLPMIISAYPEDVILEINGKFSEDFGYAAADVVGKTSAQAGLWHRDTGAGSFVDLLGSRPEISGLGMELKTASALMREMLISSRVLDYRGRKCLLTVCLDVTEQKQMEEMLRQTQKMEAVGQLAGGVAHDFNNMLSAIMGSAELLAYQFGDNPKAMSFVSTILEAAGRSADLTQQLLAFSRKGKRELVPLSMDDAIRTVMAMLERTIDKGITLETRLKAADPIIMGDPTLLKNALLNLGINARDAMPEGGTITVATAGVVFDHEFAGAHDCAVCPGNYLEVSVIDTGVGMREEVLEQIFQPFFTTKADGKGTGLGLAAVYRTVVDHRGCITVESAPGRGTVFKLYLPLCRQEETVAAQEEESVTGSGGVLLVDDEPLIRKSGKEMLEEMGYRVFLAQDGEQALEVYGVNRAEIALVILDMVMPRLGGEKALRQFRERYPEARVLLSSGMEWTGTRSDFERYPAQGFIHKPYRKAELCKAMALALVGPEQAGEQSPATV